MKFISIGPMCNTTELLKELKIRNNSYPFDWIFSSLELIEDCIKDRFVYFLDKNLYYDISDARCKHSYYQKMIKSKTLIKYHKECSFCKYADDYEWYLFNHHDLTDDETYNALVRRCNRFLQNIDNEECCLIYMNEILNDSDDIINFYKNIIESKDNIHVIGLIKGNNNNLIYNYKKLKIYNYNNKSYISSVISELMI